MQLNCQMTAILELLQFNSSSSSQQVEAMSGGVGLSLGLKWLSSDLAAPQEQQVEPNRTRGGFTACFTNINSVAAWNHRQVEQWRCSRRVNETWRESRCETFLQTSSRRLLPRSVTVGTQEWKPVIAFPRVTPQADAQHTQTQHTHLGTLMYTFTHSAE